MAIYEEVTKMPPFERKVLVLIGMLILITLHDSSLQRSSFFFFKPKGSRVVSFSRFFFASLELIINNVIQSGGGGSRVENNLRTKESTFYFVFIQWKGPLNILFASF